MEVIKVAKYSEEVKAKCVEAIKAGKKLVEVSKEFGPNPKAIQRYCKKEGVEMPKPVKKAKVAKKAEDIVKKA